MKEPKPKKCKICKELFLPVRPLQMYCGFECAIAASYIVKRKAWTKEKKVIKEKLKTHSDWLNELQVVFNNYIRARDKNEPCLSCGIKTASEWHASHYYPTTKSALRFNEDNVWKCCNRCNVFLRGNLIEYREHLIDKIGIERVEMLDKHRNDKLDLTKDQILELIKKYKDKVLQIKTI